MSFLSHNPAETMQHACDFSAQCSPGTIIRLHGTLGAGKTTWVQGLVSGLGCSTGATSPSFALLHEYRGGRLDVFHWDLYRLECDTDWSVLDLPEHLPSNGVTVIEWSGRYPGPWPTENIWDLHIEPGTNNQRSLQLSPANT